ncbi:19251_t:CDS:2 [Rhizophagus irregularis]|nr:19251_t:CDS:2 [Rhizophagus irregularis]
MVANILATSSAMPENLEDVIGDTLERIFVEGDIIELIGNFFGEPVVILGKLVDCIFVLLLFILTRGQKVSQTNDQREEDPEVGPGPATQTYREGLSGQLQVLEEQGKMRVLRTNWSVKI